MMSLSEKIKTHEAKVVVVGIGYVGLPLCVEMARAGFATTGLDRSEHKVAELRAGRTAPRSSTYMRDWPKSSTKRVWRPARDAPKTMLDGFTSRWMYPS